MDLPAPIGRDALRRRCETDLAPALRALEADPHDAAAFQALLSDLAGRAIPGARWAPEGSASGARVQASGLFGGRICESRAGLVGATRPGLVFAEIRLHDLAETADLFRGLFFGFDIGGTARGTTLVLPQRVGPAIAEHDALETMLFDDPAFDRVFRVLTSDPYEAGALLPDSTRAGLLRLREAARAPVSVSLADARLCVAVEYDRPLLADGARMDLARVADIAELFGLVDIAAAALPSWLALALPGTGAAAPPARPATSLTRLTRRPGAFSLEYTGSVSPVALAFSAVGALLLPPFWFGVLLDTLGHPGTVSSPLPVAVATLLWLYAAPAWWGPVRRIDIEGGVIAIRRGVFRTARVPVASVRVLEARKGVLYADEHALSPSLRGAELQWLASELGSVLPPDRSEPTEATTNRLPTRRP